MFKVERTLQEDKDKKKGSVKSTKDDQNDDDMNDGYDELEVTQLPFLRLSDIGHLLDLPESIVTAEEKKNLAKEAEEVATKDNLSGWYGKLIPKSFLNESTLTTIKAAVQEKRESLEKNIEACAERDEDSATLNAKLELLLFVMFTGQEDARTMFEEIFPKVIGSSLRIDMVFSLLLIDMTLSVNSPDTMDTMRRLEAMVEREGDWSRRNRLSAYKCMILMSFRDFATVSQLSSSTLTTFTSTELFSLDHFALTAVITSICSMSRVDLKKKIIESPDLIQVFNENPTLRELLMSFYECRYGDFFRTLLKISPDFKKSRYVHLVENILYRELRLAAYKQFLKSYRAVTIGSMATLFQVSIAFIEKEVSKFITSGRLQCRIDSIEGVIEMYSAETKQEKFTQLIKSSDNLTARVQKLTQKLKSV